MKSLTLITLMLAAVMAQAQEEVQEYQIKCQVPANQKVSVTFSGTGSIQKGNPKIPSSDVAAMDLTLKSPESEESFREVFYGSLSPMDEGFAQTPEGTKSFNYVGAAEHMQSVDGKPMTLQMYSGGPTILMSSKIVVGNSEYQSNCVATEVKAK